MDCGPCKWVNEFRRPGSISCRRQHTKSSEREAALESRISLNDQRIQTVTDAVERLRGASVVDMGCGEGRLLSVLLKERGITRLVGMDVSIRALEYAAERLNLDRLPRVADSQAYVIRRHQLCGVGP